MMRVLRPLEMSVLTVIMLVGIIALATELTEYEELAKIIVIPSLILLIIMAGYEIVKIASQRGRF